MKELKKIVTENLVPIIIILATVLILFMIPGFINLDSPSDSINSSINSVQNISVKSNETINMTDEDKNFKNWFYLSFRSIIDDINCISKAAEKQNFSDTARCGGFLADDSDRSLGQINTYNVSASVQEALNEYRKSLEDYIIGGSNLEMGAKNMNIQQMNNATMYIQNGTARMERIVSLL